MIKKVHDGYKNFAKKIGTKEGATSALKMYSTPHNSELYGVYYDEDKLIQRIIEAPVEDAFMTGIESENSSIVDLFEAKKHLMRDAIINSRIYGLSVIYENNILDDSQITSLSVEQNPEREDYLKPKGVATGTINNLDEKRLIFVQQHATNNYILESGGYGYSIVKGILPFVERYYASLAIGTDIMGEINQSVIKMQDLNELIAEGREDDLRSRLDVINYYKSNLSTLLIDKEDEYINVTKTLSGTKDVIEKNELSLCAVASMPYSRLFGRQQGGLSNGAETDLKSYFDTVVSKIRENYVTKIFTEIIEKEGIVGKWSFLPVYQQNAKEKADTLKSNTESVIKLMENGIIDEEEAKALLGI